MPKFSAIPDFTNNIESMATTLRAMKDVVEQLGGLRQGENLGAPSMFVQMVAPKTTLRQTLKRGDLWVQTNPNDSGNGSNTLPGNLYYWDGSVWHEIYKSSTSP